MVGAEASDKQRDALDSSIRIPELKQGTNQMMIHSVEQLQGTEVGNLI